MEGMFIVGLTVGWGGRLRDLGEALSQKPSLFHLKKKRLNPALWRQTMGERHGRHVVTLRGGLEENTGQNKPRGKRPCGQGDSPRLSLWTRSTSPETRHISRKTIRGGRQPWGGGVPSEKNGAEKEKKGLKKNLIH